MLHTIQQFIVENPYHWLAIIISSFILEDPTTLYVSTGIHTQKISYAYGFISLIIGLSLGDLGLYFLGKGGRALRPSQSKSISGWWIFFARFFPGLRVPAYAMSGYTNYSLWKFLILNLASSAIWTAILFQSGSTLFHSFGWKGIGLAMIGLIAVSQIVKHYKNLNDKRNRSDFLPAEEQRK